MRLKIYKGFDVRFLSQIVDKPLIDNNIEDKINVFALNEDYADELEEAMILKKSEDALWITYEEFELVKDSIFLRAQKGKVVVEIIRNNIYPDLYPLGILLGNELFEKWISHINDYEKNVSDESINLLDKFYSKIHLINGHYYISYHNFEYPNNPNVETITNYYDDSINVEKANEEDYLVDIGDDLEKYIEHIETIESKNIKKITYKMICNTEISRHILYSLKAYLKKQGQNTIFEYTGEYALNSQVKNELVDIAKNILKINSFEFRQLDFYKQPEISKETEKISQGEIMEYIISEAEKAYANERYRDIFITAPTGSGKSLIFQIPSIYLSSKYGKLIIIVEPLKGLQLDQQNNLINVGYLKSAYLNSDIATMAEREKIIKNVKSGKIDILYVSPETLLSHSIESLIGEREIGLVIVDEAHIVATWGVGFRPDYWYLGSYLNRMRSKKDKFGTAKTYHNFPIFACTATAVNGGPDDMVSETIISLYMNDPIIKIGTVKRDNIKFDIRNYTEETYDEYKTQKVEVLNRQIETWINKKEKTIIYCPYRTIAHRMKNAEKEFTSFEKYKMLTGVYTGNSENSFEKNEAMKKFANGQINVMYATKAFGMGIDIPDILNVYHYAVTGGLSDYVQEIGRSARKKGLIGKAIVDYFKGDMKYTAALFGMSQIRQYHIRKCLAIIYDTYKNNGYRRNFLVNPKMFESVFSDLNSEGSLNKIKIVLLMLEKDFWEKYKTYVLISRPSSIYTKGYVCIDKIKESEILKSRFGKYFNKVSSGRKNEKVLGSVDTIVSDLGDIYELNFKDMWEKEYGSEMSFAGFKYSFFKNNYSILKEYSQYVYNRIKIKVKSKNGMLNEIFQRAKDEIDYLTDTLGTFERNYFTKDEFKEKIVARYINESKCEIIANSYFDIIDPSGTCIRRRVNNEIIKYQISNGRIRELGMQILKKSTLLKKMALTSANELSNFYNENVADENLLKLLSLLDLIMYEVEGGSEPEIFIRLNAPDKIKNIVEDKIIYRNRYAELAKEKHYRSTKILDYFFRHFDNSQNDKRWDFVEKYFLGENVEEEIESPVLLKKKSISLSKCINLEDSKIQSLKEFKDWDSIIEKLFSDNANEKYKYYCKEMKNLRMKKPDYAFATLKINNKNYEAMFVYEEDNLIVVNEFFGYDKKIECEKVGYKVVVIDKIEEDLEKIDELIISSDDK